MFCKSTHSHVTDIPEIWQFFGSFSISVTLRTSSLGVGSSSAYLGSGYQSYAFGYKRCTRGLTYFEIFLIEHSRGAMFDVFLQEFFLQKFTTPY
jgi:hypothetical protein